MPRLQLDPATGSSWSPTACWTQRRDLDLPAMLSRDARTHPRELVYELAETVLHATGGGLTTTPPCSAWTGAAPRRRGPPGPRGVT